MRVALTTLAVLALAVPAFGGFAFFDDFESYADGELEAVSGGNWVIDDTKTSDMTVSGGVASVTPGEGHQYQTRTAVGEHADAYMSMKLRYDGNAAISYKYQMRGFNSHIHKSPHPAGIGFPDYGSDFDGDYVELGIWNGGSLTGAGADTTIYDGDWHRVVYRWDTVNDKMYLWVDPTTDDYTPDVSEADVAVDDLTGSAHTWAGINLWAYGDQGGWSMDEIALVPEPATMALLGLGGLGVLIRKRR